MTRQLKVYGWTYSRAACPPAANSSHQTREIMAAHSVAEVLRVAGISRRDFEWNGCETGNSAEVTLALANPGIVFWRPRHAGMDQIRNAATGERVEITLPERLRDEANDYWPERLAKLLREAADALEERA